MGLHSHHLSPSNQMGRRRDVFRLSRTCSEKLTNPEVSTPVFELPRITDWWNRTVTITATHEQTVAFKITYHIWLVEFESCWILQTSTYCAPEVFLGEHLDHLLKSNNIDFEYMLKLNCVKLANFEMFKNLPLFYKEIFMYFNQCKKLQKYQV